MLHIKRGVKFTEAQIVAMKENNHYYLLFGKMPAAVVVYKYNNVELIKARWPGFMLEVGKLIADGTGHLCVINGKVLGDLETFRERATNALQRIVACVPPDDLGFQLWRLTGKSDSNGFATHFSLESTSSNETFHNRAADYVGPDNVGRALGAALVIEGTVHYNCNLDTSKHGAQPAACRDEWLLSDVDAGLGHSVTTARASGSCDTLRAIDSTRPACSSTYKLTKRPLFGLPLCTDTRVRQLEVISDAVKQLLLPSTGALTLDATGERLDMPKDSMRCTPHPGSLPQLLLLGGGLVLPIASQLPPAPPAASLSTAAGRKRAVPGAARVASAFFDSSLLHEVAAAAGEAVGSAEHTLAGKPVRARRSIVRPRARVTYLQCSNLFVAHACCARVMYVERRRTSQKRLLLSGAGCRRRLRSTTTCARAELRRRSAPKKRGIPIASKAATGSAARALCQTVTSQRCLRRPKRAPGPTWWHLSPSREPGRRGKCSL